MKKYIFLFIIFSSAGVLYLSFPVNSRKNFVSIEENRFELNGKEFFPIVVNYIVSTRADKSGLWASPYFGYTPDSMHVPASKDSCLMQLRADMELIKEMGFNAVRLLEIGDESVHDKKSGALAIRARTPAGADTACLLFSEQSYKNYFAALDELFDIINEAGLKIIFKVHLIPEIKTTEEHLKKVAQRFKEDTVIMAYDLFNEPLYFDSLLDRTKENVYETAKGWDKIITMYAPNQLTTIGLSGIREIFRWDPNILDVDFISFHPYNHEPGQVMNEIYWYGKHVKKPWIIGETAISADNDSITYNEQKDFASLSLNQARNCGAIGYSWWQYKDVQWFSYLANYMGTVTRKGETKTRKNNLTVLGTVKPVADAFKTFDPNVKKEDCICLNNYYNYSEGKKFRIIGRLTDDDGDPIEGGVVLAWDEHWYPSYHTTTKADGSFELLGKCKFFHWIASATSHSMTRGEISPDTARTYTDTIPTIRLGEIELEELGF